MSGLGTQLCSLGGRKGGKEMVTHFNDNFSPRMFDHGETALQGGESSGLEKSACYTWFGHEEVFVFISC